MRHGLVLLIFIGAIAVADTTSNAAKVQVLFTPGDNIAAAIVQAIRNATQSIRVQSFNFTNKAIGRALQDAQRRGIAVTILADQEQFEKGASFIVRDLKSADIQVKLDGAHRAAHNKIMLIDDDGVNPIIITGSFNFTQAAQKSNAENIVLIHNDKALAKAYRDNWQQHWRHGVAIE